MSSKDHKAMLDLIVESQYWTGTRDDATELLATHLANHGGKLVKRKQPPLKPTSKSIKEKQIVKSKQKMGISDKNITELKGLCREYGIKGFSKLKKQGLVDAIEVHLATLKPTTEVADQEQSAAPAPSPVVDDTDLDAPEPEPETKLPTANVESVEDEDDSHHPDSDDELLLETDTPTVEPEPPMWGDLSDGDVDYESSAKVTAALVGNNIFAEDYE